MKMNQQNSIFSAREEQYLLQRLSERGRKQLESLRENKTLDQFLEMVVGSDELVAYEQGQNRIAWGRGTGITVEMEESFYADSGGVSQAINEVRKVFFESFVDDEVLKELAEPSEEAEPNSEAVDGEVDQVDAPQDAQAIEASEEDPEEEEDDLLSRVGELDQNTLGVDDEEIHADEFSNLAEVDPGANAKLDDEPEEEDLLARVGELDQSTLSGDQDEVHADEFSNLSEISSDEPEIQPQEIEGDETTVEQEPQALVEPEPEPEPATEAVDIDALIDAEVAGGEAVETVEPEAPEAEATTDDTDIDALIDAEMSAGESGEEPQPEVVTNESAPLEDEAVADTGLAEDAVLEESTEDVDEELNACIARLKELGMDDERIETLVSAVREGKAPIELVQKTIEKLSKT
jgi:hypothetical protein